MTEGKSMIKIAHPIMSQEFLFQQKTALLHVMKQEDETALKLRVFASIHRSTLKTCSLR